MKMYKKYKLFLYVVWGFIFLFIIYEKVCVVVFFILWSVVGFFKYEEGIFKFMLGRK